MDVEYDPKANNSKLIFHYLDEIKDENGNKLPKNILTDNVSRVYIIVVNNKIYKIGQSSDKKGIKGTLNIYKDGGVKGRPSVRSYGIFHFLMEEIKKGHKISFYMIYQNSLKGDIKGLFKIHENQDIQISPKIIEERCLADFLAKENGKYPIWNLQERGEDWPKLIKTIHKNILDKSLNKGRNN